MALLAAKAYDPASSVLTNLCSALQAMAPLDTTNLQNTFTAPSNGSVLVRLRTVTRGSGGTPMILMGVMDATTSAIMGRQAPMTSKSGAAGSQRVIRECMFVVTGLTPSQVYTWNAAWAVQVAVALSTFGYGGPNDTTGDNAFGAFVFEIWEADNLLAGTLYDPAVAVTKTLASLLAQTALDTTNLRLSFNAPQSGNVEVKLRGVASGATGANPQPILGVLDGATVRGRLSGLAQIQASTGLATDYTMFEAVFPVLGLTPGANYVWDASYGNEVVLAGYNILYGGPNDAVGNDAWGGFAYEVWAA